MDVSMEIFTKGMLFIFLPILIICVLYWIKVYKYATYYSNDKEKMYQIKFNTHLLAIIIFFILFVINICFNIYFNQKVMGEDIAKLIIFLVSLSPIVPLVFLLTNIVGLVNVLSSKNKKDTEMDVL